MRCTACLLGWSYEYKRGIHLGPILGTSDTSYQEPGLGFVVKPRDRGSIRPSKYRRFSLARKRCSYLRPIRCTGSIASSQELYLDQQLEQCHYRVPKECCECHSLGPAYRR